LELLKPENKCTIILINYIRTRNKKEEKEKLGKKITRNKL